MENVFSGMYILVLDDAIIYLPCFGRDPPRQNVWNSRYESNGTVTSEMFMSKISASLLSLYLFSKTTEIFCSIGQTASSETTPRAHDGK